MYYVPELLCLAKKGKLARCWLASILSEQMFKNRVSNKDVMDVDLVVTCDEILKVLNRNSGNSSCRFSLYLSSNLMYGVVKLQLYQLTLLEKSLTMTLYNLRSINLDGGRKKNKKTTHSDPVLSIDLQTDFIGDLTIIPEPPLLTFDDLPSTDVNLLELSPRVVQKPEDEAHSPTYFPALTEKEADEWIDILSNDDFGQGDSEHQRASRVLSTEEGRLPAVRLAPDASARMDVSSIRPRAGQKRSSSGDVTDTSAKRRRMLDFEPPHDVETGQLSQRPILEESDQPIPEESDQPILEESYRPILEESYRPIHEESDQPILEESYRPIPEKSDRPIERPIHVELDQPILAPNREELDEPIARPASPQVLSVREETTLAEPADFNVPRQAKKTRRGKPKSHRIDKNTTISEAVRRRNAADRDAGTVPLSIVTAVAETRRAVPLSTMLQRPAMALEFGTDRPPSARQNTYSDDLTARFETARSGPFAEVTGYCDILDYIRKKHATIESVPSGFANRTGPEVPSQEDPTPEAVDSVSARPVDDAHAAATDGTGPKADSEARLPLIEVTDERIEENVSEAQAVAINDEQPALIMPDEDGEAIYRPQESVADSSRPVVVLPPALTGKDRATTTRRDERRTEADEEIASSTSSDRSEQAEAKWTKENLIESLSSEWRVRSEVPFKKLNPPGEKKIDAAGCFSFLLDLRMEKKVFLKQRDQVYIEKAGSWDIDD